MSNLQLKVRDLKKKDMEVVNVQDGDLQYQHINLPSDSYDSEDYDGIFERVRIRPDFSAKDNFDHDI